MKKKSKPRSSSKYKSCKRGQTMVEYVLVGLSVVAIAISVFSVNGPLNTAAGAGMARLGGLLSG